MPNAGEQHARADRHRRRITAGEQFDGDVPLVVVHRDERIEIAPAEHQVGADRTFDIQARHPRFLRRER